MVDSKTKHSKNLSPNFLFNRRTFVGIRFAKFEHHDELLRALSTVPPGERRDPMGLAHFVCNHTLHVLWMHVPPAQNDYILGATRNVELAVNDETQVSGPEPSSAEGVFRRRGISEVLLHERGARDLNFTHVALFENAVGSCPRALAPGDAKARAVDWGAHRNQTPGLVT